MKRPEFLIALRTLAGFAVGFLCLWSRPTPAGGESPSKPPGETRKAGASSSPRTQGVLAGRLEAKRRAAKLTPGEARAVMEGLKPPVEDGDKAWLTEVLACWAGAEPEAAADWLRGWSRNGPVDEEWFRAGLSPLAGKDLRAALAIGRVAYAGYGRMEEILLTAAARVDPARAMAFTTMSHELAFYAAPAFGVWLRRDPGTACEWLLHSPLLNYMAIKDVVADLAAVAPDRIPGVLAMLPKDSDVREAALQSLAASEVEHDPVAALAKLAALSEDERRRMLGPLTEYLVLRGKPTEITALLAGLGEAERPSAIEALKSQVSYATEDRALELLALPGLSETEKANLFKQAYSLGPEHAEAFLGAMQKLNQETPREMASFWERNLRNHLEESLPVLHTMAAEGKLDKESLLNLTSTMSRNGSPAVDRLIAALPEKDRASPLAVQALFAALNSPGADLAAFTSLPDEKTRVEALAAVFDERSGRMDAETRLKLFQNLPEASRIDALAAISTPEKEEAASVRQAVESAVHADPNAGGSVESAIFKISTAMGSPAAALEWVNTLPVGKAQDSGRVRAFQTFAYADTPAASAWLNTQPLETPRRDDMVEALVRRFRDDELVGAQQWAATIQSEEKRRAVQEFVASRVKEQSARK